MKLWELMEAPIDDIAVTKWAKEVFATLVRYMSHANPSTLSRTTKGEPVIEMNLFPDLNVPDLLVVISPPKGRTKGEWRKWRDKNIITLYGEEKDLPYWESTFIHEFVHYRDHMRNNGHSTVVDDEDHHKYSNDPYEMNAHYHQLTSRLTSAIAAVEKSDKPDAVREMYQALTPYRTFDLFWRDAMKDLTMKGWYNALTDDNKRKIKSRAYKLYQEWHNVIYP